MTLRFTCGEKKNLVKHQNVSKYYDMDCLQIFLLLLMSLLTIPIVKNSHILAGVYFIFLRKRPRPNAKVYQYQTWYSAKRSKN